MDFSREDNFRIKLDQIGIVLEKRQMCQFMKYYDLLAEWNTFMNLTAIIEYEEVLTKHFVDSLSLVKAYDMTNNISLIDIGTGAGFPGIPLKIAFPNIKVTLLDSLNKRVKFLNEVINVLELTNISAVHGRAEDFAKKSMYRESYDICVSRAVANLSTLTELCLPFVKIGGKFISYKSEKVLEEIRTAQNAISILGGKISGQIEFILPESDMYRNLFVIDKIKKTPKQYPRKAGLPAKEPIN